MKNTSYKNIVIGFGKGGKTLAGFLAKKGETVALIERSPKMYGGTCINVACIPTKSLITQTERGVSYASAHGVKDKLTETLRGKNYDKLAGLGVTLIDGEASFVSASEVRVKTVDGERILTAERIFINTGTAPFMPPIKGIDGKGVYSSTSFMELTQIPESVAIVGGGFVGLEFASMLLGFGAKVTLIDKSAEFLPREDRDMAESIHQSLVDRGLELVVGARVLEFASGDDAVTVQYETAGQKRSLATGAVLVAAGRTPQTQSLNLQAAGIATDERGFIKVNDQLQTTAKNVWALGDVHGGPQFTYISLDDFRIVKNQLMGGAYNTLGKRRPFATSVFLSPPYARVGLNETEAKAQGVDYKLFSLPAAAIPKAAVLGQKDGLLKALVDVPSGKILGCTLFCAEAHELINLVKLAMDADVSYEILRDAVYTHPTMAEGLNDLFA